jgi:hypothetical protein
MIVGVCGRCKREDWRFPVSLSILASDSGVCFEESPRKVLHRTQDLEKGGK